MVTFWIKSAGCKGEKWIKKKKLLVLKNWWAKYVNLPAFTFFYIYYIYKFIAYLKSFLIRGWLWWIWEKAFMHAMYLIFCPTEIIFRKDGDNNSLNSSSNGNFPFLFFSFFLTFLFLKVETALVLFISLSLSSHGKIFYLFYFNGEEWYKWGPCEWQWCFHSFISVPNHDYGFSMIWWMMSRPELAHVFRRRRERENCGVLDLDWIGLEPTWGWGWGWGGVLPIIIVWFMVGHVSAPFLAVWWEPRDKHFPFSSPTLLPFFSLTQSISHYICIYICVCL